MRLREYLPFKPELNLSVELLGVCLCECAVREVTKLK